METAFKAGTVDTRPASALQGTDLASSSYPNCANTLRRRCPLAREECLDLCPHGALHLSAFVDSREGWDLHRWRRGDRGSTLWHSAWHSFAERPAQPTLASASQVPKPVSFAVRSHLALTVMSRSTRA